MSLYRPIPALNLTANVDQPLSPLNLRDYGKLLYWIFFFPQAVQHHVQSIRKEVEQNNAEQLNRESRSRRGLFTLALMALMLLLVMLVLVALALYFLQTTWVGLSQVAAQRGAVGGAVIGLGSALLVYLLQRSQKRPAHAVVLGMATGVAYALIGMIYLGEALDHGMLDMLWALIYGFIAGSSIGVLMNLALILTDEQPPAIPGQTHLNFVHWG